MEKVYKDFSKSIKKDIKNSDEIYTLCVIVGLDNFIREGIIEEFEFNDLLTTAKNNGKHSFIIIDNNDSMNGHIYDSWYTNYVDNNNGIWVGNGIENQNIISYKFSIEGLENNCGNSFGYVINDGKPTLLKLIGMEGESKDG